MNKKKATFWLLLAAGLLLVAGVSVAAFSEVGILFQAETGKVAIHLEEYAVENGKEVPWKDGSTVLPGGVVSKIPRIFNDGEDCYVRAKMEFTSEKESEMPLTTDSLLGISKDWKQVGEYYYYCKVLKEKERVTLFQGIRIPQEWKSGVDDKNRWDVNIQAEAIQAAFFQPDFSSEDPWNLGGKTEILEAPEEEPVDPDVSMEPVVLEIAQDTKGFDVNSQEFFQTMEQFLPGSSQVGHLKLTNQTGQKRAVYLRAEILEKNELLEKLELEIRKKEKNREVIVYQGSMLAEKLQEYRKLAEVDGEETVQIEFHVKLPEDADNRYAARQGKVKFYLTTETPPKVVKAVKTGDEMGSWLLWTAIGSGFVLFIEGGRRIRKRRAGGRI